MVSSDLRVEQISDSLQGKHIDVVVSGSIGAVESTRFIRSLRRLGARVTPWITEGAQQFTTETALSWAAAESVVTSFSGEASHIALGDACIIAPASASIIGKIVSGLTDSPSSALVASYLGQNKTVMFLPNMHQSLSDSPFIQENIQKISKYCVPIPPRMEEGKLKFPEPGPLADLVSHELNRSEQDSPALIAMGTTRGYMDDVRYISNYSSGSLGSKISEELFRQGVKTQVIAGPCPHLPKVYSELVPIKTNEELEAESSLRVNRDQSSVIFAASVLDFVPDSKFEGKLRSNEQLEVNFKQTVKIIGKLNPNSGLKVGFKLEPDLNIEQAEAIAKDYMTKYKLSMIVINSLKDVDAIRHKAYVFTRGDNGLVWVQLESKQAIAAAISQHIKKAPANG